MGKIWGGSTVKQQVVITSRFLLHMSSFKIILKSCIKKQKNITLSAWVKGSMRSFIFLLKYFSWVNFEKRTKIPFFQKLHENFKFAKKKDHLILWTIRLFVMFLNFGLIVFPLTFRASNFEAGAPCPLRGKRDYINRF